MFRQIVFTVVCLNLLTFCAAQRELPLPGDKTGSAKWVRINTNFVLYSAEEMLAIVDKAKAAGANSVLLSDAKTRTFWFRSPGTKWFNRINAFRAGVRDRGMNFILSGVGLGYCSGPLANDPNLASGYPMNDVPMRVSAGGVLRPVETAEIPNGSFEDSSANRPTGWGFQDNPGELTFIDSTVARSGSKSLRLDAKPGKMSRLFGDFKVKPFQQYTLSVWVKTQALTTGTILLLIRDSANTNRRLSSQFLSMPESGGRRKYFSDANDLTFDWTEMKLPFNSLGATSASVVLGIWRGTSGKVWWDDIRLRSTPQMNLLRRSSLPFTIKTTDGRILSENSQYSGAVDPKLGQSSFQGNFDTYHDIRLISVTPASRLSEGDTVLLSGYHTTVVGNGQVGCSWTDRKLIKVIRRTYVEGNRAFSPDAILLAHNEIRTGGWEPQEVAQKTSGRALAAYMREEIRIVRKASKNKPLYVWSDMFDPGHNANADYYHVRNTLTGSWKGLSNKMITIVNWEGTSLEESGKASFTFFHKKGFTQVVAGYYDYDVQENFKAWQSAIDGRTTAGSMYTTWTKDFSQLQPFANLWW